jgi:hypothetical protein
MADPRREQPCPECGHAPSTFPTRLRQAEAEHGPERALKGACCTCRERSPEAAPARPHGGRRPGAGRPPGPARMLKAEAITVSVTEAEKARLERQAKRAGQTLSYWVRERLGLPTG